MAPRSLWPREHGAYAQIGAPLLTALALHVPTSGAILIAIGASCAFLANEPLLVVLGHRGARARELAGRRARRRLAVLVLAAVVAGTIGLALAPDSIGIAVAAAIPAAAMIALAWHRNEHSLAGELVAIVALPGAGAPVAVAAGSTWQLGVMLWAAWSIGFACSVVAVHRVIARHKRAASRTDEIVACTLAGITLGLCAITAWTPVAMVAVPLAIASTWLAIRPPRASYLRTIGFGLVIASIASGAIAVVAA